MDTTRRAILAGLASLPIMGPWLVSTARAASGPGVRAQAVQAERLHRYADGAVARPLRLLILGGTTLVGPAVVRYALDRGHQVTLFNRGLTNAHLFTDVEQLRGDRLQAASGGLAALESGRWDAVIDTWQGVPHAVTDSLAALDGRYERYLYVSSIAVYGRQNFSAPQISEDAELPDIAADHPARQLNAEGLPSYTVRKLDADKDVRRVAGQRAIVVRPHAITGRYAVPESENQMYWPRRVREGGTILAPGDGEDFMQYIDAADLGRFIVRACEQQLQGIFNTARRVRFDDFLSGLKQVAGGPEARYHWASWEVLQTHGIRPFAQLPLWVPRQVNPGFNNHRDERALAAGLSYRPFADTMRDLLACADEFLPETHQWGIDGDRGLLTRERERELLAQLESGVG